MMGRFFIPGVKWEEDRVQVSLAAGCVPTNGDNLEMRIYLSPSLVIAVVRIFHCNSNRAVRRAIKFNYTDTTLKSTPYAEVQGQSMHACDGCWLEAGIEFIAH